MNKAVFLDRDGVINHEVEYVHKIEDFKFIDDVFAACRQFNANGYLIVIVTNQAGIGYGYYTEEQFNQLNDWMLAQFAENGVVISAVKYCPHHPTKAKPPYLKTCDCRKPEPGLLLEAIEELNIDPAKSLLVGDKISDIEAGKAAGVARNYLITTGHEFSAKQALIADRVVTSLNELIPNHG